MLPPAIQNGISKIVESGVKNGSKLAWAAMAAVGTYMAEEYRKYRATIKARKEGEGYGYQKGYSTAKKEDAEEIGRVREFMRKIKKNK